MLAIPEGMAGILGDPIPKKYFRAMGKIPPDSLFVHVGRS
jgi:hypothetical protein